MVVVNQIQTVVVKPSGEHVPTNNQLGIDEDSPEQRHNGEYHREVAPDCSKVENGSMGQISIALGNTWYHAVNTRLTLHYCDNINRQVCVCR